MFARVTLFEIDMVRIDLKAALERFQRLIVPELRLQPGYRGAYVLETPEGRGLLMTLWASEENARATIESGFYDEQVAKFVMFTRQPPGRDHYEVVFVDTPVEATPGS